jgi:ribonuclease E
VVEHVIPAAPPSQSEPEPPRRRSTVREPAPVFGGQAEPPRSVVAPEPAPIEAPAPVESAVDDANKPRRTGWWAKRLLGGGDKS